jgi:hypothetical protein
MILRDGWGSGSCAVMGFCVTGAENLGFVRRALVIDQTVICDVSIHITLFIYATQHSTSIYLFIYLFIYTHVYSFILQHFNAYLFIFQLLLKSM